MTIKQAERLCERAQKYGYVDNVDGELIYCGHSDIHGDTYSVRDVYGNTCCYGTKHEIIRFYTTL